MSWERGDGHFADQGGAAHSLTQPSASAQHGDLHPAPPSSRQRSAASLMEPSLVSEGPQASRRSVVSAGTC